MKITHRISTGQFEYVEVEHEALEEMPDENIRTIHDGLKAAFAPKPTNQLSDKEFDQFIQRMMEGDDNHIDQMEQMSEKQKWAMQICKRALARIEYKRKRKEEGEADIGDAAAIEYN